MAATGTGLEYTFIIMLAPLFAAGVLLLMSRRAYLRDVATADATERQHPALRFMGAMGRASGVGPGYSPGSGQGRRRSWRQTIFRPDQSSLKAATFTSTRPRGRTISARRCR